MIHSRLNVLILTVVAAIALVGCQNHFVFYKVAPETVAFDLLLEGQLDDAPRDVTLMSLSHFANPVEKRHDGKVERINNRNAHLSWYDLYQPHLEPTRTVRFNNQFGQHSVRIQEAKSLLVPTRKTSDPAGSSFPSTLDHYKCYEIVHLSLVPSLPSVMLTDQFGTEGSLPVGDPVYFCVPVSKQRIGAEVEPIKKEAFHLAIYELPAKAKTAAIVTRDQFGDHSLAVEELVYLAVPTIKQEVEPPP
jgi:hypothetical protein